MDYGVHSYTGDGMDAIRQFLCDRVFAADVLSFVENRPDGNRWFLKSSQQTGPGVFVVTFITNEYCSPGHPTAVLRVKVVAPEHPGEEWVLSIG